MSCDCSSARKNEDREYVLTVKAFITVDACCEDVAEDSDFSLSDADDWEIIDIEQAWFFFKPITTHLLGGK